MKLNGWQRAFGLLTVAWLAYWFWITRGMSFDGGDVPFILRVVLLPPVVLYAIGWLFARVVRLVRK